MDSSDLAKLLNTEYRRQRKDTGLTQTYLTKLTGLETTRISNIFNGHKRPNLKEANLIAHALGYDLHFTLTDKGE